MAGLYPVTGVETECNLFAYRDLVSDPMFECNGLLFLRIAEGRAITLKYIDDSPVRTLGGAWRAHFIYTGLGCVFLLGLKQPSGQLATWILSPDGRRLGDRLADLAGELAASIAAVLLSRGSDMPRGLIHDGLQWVEPFLLGGLLDLATAARAVNQPGEASTATHRALAMLGAPFKLSTHLQYGTGEPGLLLHEGWDAEGGVGRACAPSSIARAGLVPLCTRALLTLELTPLELDKDGPHTAVEIHVNGRNVGVADLHPEWNREGAILSFWLASDLVSDKPFEIAFGHALGFRLVSLKLELDHAQGAGVLDPAALMLRFENIGDNCEFGLVQRHFKAEPVGLLRFAGLRTPQRLVRLLADDFGQLGSAGSLGVFTVAGEYWIVDHVYGLAAHTFRYQHECSAEEVIGENEIKVTYLRRKLREDLEDGEKILVYKRVVTQDLHEILALHAALNQYGSINKLLWVTEADEHHAPGDVHWVGDRLLKGYVGRISLTNAHHYDADIWLLLCRNAWAAFSGLSGL